MQFRREEMRERFGGKNIFSTVFDGVCKRCGLDAREDWGRKIYL